MERLKIQESDKGLFRVHPSEVWIKVNKTAQWFKLKKIVFFLCTSKQLFCPYNGHHSLMDNRTRQFQEKNRGLHMIHVWFESNQK